MARVTLSFSADTEADRDIIAWWEELAEQKANRSAEVRAAIRQYRDAKAWTLGDVMAGLGELKRMVRNGARVIQAGSDPQADGQAETEADPLAVEAQGALDSLGGL